MATISFGPILMHPEAKKEVHHLLLNSAEICNFRLLKYNGIYIDDGKSFENIIKFNGEKITFKFEDPKREDFSIDIKGTEGLQVKHSVKNDRDLTILFLDGYQQYNECAYQQEKPSLGEDNHQDDDGKEEAISFLDESQKMTPQLI